MERHDDYEMAKDLETKCVNLKNMSNLNDLVQMYSSLMRECTENFAPQLEKKLLFYDH